MSNNVLMLTKRTQELFAQGLRPFPNSGLPVIPYIDKIAYIQFTESIILNVDFL